LDLHHISGHDRDCFGLLPDQEIIFHGGNASSTIGTSPADSQSTSETHRNTGDQQPDHQIKCVNPHSYQHLVKKLPEERERYLNNIRRNINDEF
jgi:hypothetical protein